MIDIKKVEGSDRGNVFLFALSTCIWCKKTKAFLDDNKIAYSYVFMDELDGSSREEMKAKLKKWNPSCSYPTLVVNDSKCIIGFNPDDILQELK